MAITAIAGSFILFGPPARGLADNGDFWRVMAPAGIQYLPPEPARYRELALKYELVPAQLSTATTLATLPAWAAAAGGRAFGGFFDLRLLGALNFALFLGGLALFLRDQRNWVFGPGLSWLVLDPSYILHFNSFYSQSFALVLMPWLLWSLGRAAAAPTHPRMTALACFAFLISTSKLQFALLPVVLMAALSATISPPKKRTALALVPVLLGALAFSFLPSSPARTGLRAMNRYHAIFTGVAPLTNEPAATLSSLGIPSGYHYLSGTGMFDPPALGRITAELNERLIQVPLLSISYQYLAHPEALRRSLPLFSRALGDSRLAYLGNYATESNLPGKNFSPGWRWAEWRDLPYRWIPGLPWILVLITPFLLWRSWRSEPWQALALFLWLDFLIQLPIALVGNGYYSFGRLLLPARLDLDLLTLLLITRVPKFGKIVAHRKIGSI